MKTRSRNVIRQNCSVWSDIWHYPVSDIRSTGYLVYWMSSLLDIRSTECPVYLISGLLDIRSTWYPVYWISGLLDIRSTGYPVYLISSLLDIRSTEYIQYPTWYQIWFWLLLNIWYSPRANARYPINLISGPSLCKGNHSNSCNHEQTPISEIMNRPRFLYFLKSLCLKAKLFDQKDC